MLSQYIKGDLPDQLNWVDRLAPDDVEVALYELQEKFYATPHLFKSKLTEQDVRSIATIGELVRYISAKIEE